MSILGRKRIKLKIATADPATEIYVIDGKFHLVERGIGKMEPLLDRGIYKIKVRAGYETKEEHIILRGDREEEVRTFAPLRFSSAAPIVNTAKASKSHVEMATKEAREAHVKVGKGSWIYIFSRNYAPSNEEKPIRNPVNGLTLSKADGGPLVDLSQESKVNLSEGSCAACNIEIDPGTYRLRLDVSPSRSLEQIVVASHGWQTQVFLADHGKEAEPGSPSVGISESTVLLCRPCNFKADDPSLRLTELLKQALAYQRHVLSDEIREIIKQNKTHPMIGIYGAHLELLEEKPDAALLDIVIKNLRNMLGTHPDVEALALKTYGLSGTNHIFRLPPILRKSWSYIIDATGDKTKLVPQDSLASRIATQLWADDLWLRWIGPLEPKTTSAVDAAAEHSAAAVQQLLMSAIEKYAEFLAHRKEAGRVQKTGSYPGMNLILGLRLGSIVKSAYRLLPEGVVQFFESIKGLMRQELEIGAAGDDQPKPSAVSEARDKKYKVNVDEENIGELVKMLGIPRANLEALLEKMNEKIED